MNKVLFALALASFALYAFAIARMFSREYGVAWQMRALQSVGTASAMAHLWVLAHAGILPIARSLLAAGVYVLGFGVFAAAASALRGTRLTLAYSPDAPKVLITQGIYRHIRHPLYLAYSLTWLAGAIAVPVAATVLSTAMLSCIYIQAARAEERKFARSSLALTYTKYRERARLF